VSFKAGSYSPVMQQPPVTTDPALVIFRSAIMAAYGNRIERIVLFGSRARGGARADSDYDVAIFLEGLVDRWAEIDRLTEIELDVMDETGAFIHTTLFRAGSWADATPLMHDIRCEGVIM
jgi:uncharacterized protein